MVNEKTKEKEKHMDLNENEVIELNVPGVDTGIVTVVDDILYGIYKHRLFEYNYIVPITNDDISELDTMYGPSYLKLSMMSMDLM